MNPARLLSSRLRVPEGILFQDLQGETVLLNLNTGVYFGLDPVGTRIWQLIQEQQSLQKVQDCLLEEYDVTRDQGLQDLLALITQLQEKGLIEVSHAAAP